MKQPVSPECSPGSVEWIRVTMPMVRRLAASLARRLPSSMSMEDLVSAGFLALVALQRRHPEVTPEELAQTSAARVRGAMLDELRAADPLSRRTRRRVRAIDQATATFEARHGRRPSDVELAGLVGVSTPDAVAAQVVARRAKTALQEGESPERTATATGMSPEEHAHRRQRFARFTRAVEALPGRQRRVVELYFGEDQTLRQVGEHLGVTEARVSQMLSGAVKQLRVTCASVPPPA